MFIAAIVFLSLSQVRVSDAVSRTGVKDIKVEDKKTTIQLDPNRAATEKSVTITFVPMECTGSECERLKCEFVYKGNMDSISIEPFSSCKKELRLERFMDLAEISFDIFPMHGVPASFTYISNNLPKGECPILALPDAKGMMDYYRCISQPLQGTEGQSAAERWHQLNYTVHYENGSKKKDTFYLPGSGLPRFYENLITKFGSGPNINDFLEIREAERKCTNEILLLNKMPLEMDLRLWFKIGRQTSLSYWNVTLGKEEWHKVIFPDDRGKTLRIDITRIGSSPTMEFGERELSTSINRTAKRQHCFLHYPDSFRRVPYMTYSLWILGSLHDDQPIRLNT